MPNQTKEEKIDSLKNPRVSDLKMHQEHHLAEDLADMCKDWTIVAAQYSQSRQLNFNRNCKCDEFWKSKVSTEASDVYKALMPMKILQGISNMLNKNVQHLLSGKVTEQELKRKMFKAEQLYEYFGIRILMGYCKMPDVADYFNKSL
jgi:Transposase IS4